MMELDFFEPVQDRIQRFHDLYAKKRAYARHFAIFERACAHLDLGRVEAMRDKWLPILRGPQQHDYGKYFDTIYWLWHKCTHIMWLDLDRFPPQSILDLGSGPGHFVFLCKALGHSPIGLDLANDSFTDLCSMMQVDYRIAAVESGQSLPDYGRKYDLVTAIWLKFDEIYLECREPPQRIRYWSGAEWADFFRLLRPQLNPQARVFLELNNHRQMDGTLAFDERFIRSCVANGAQRITDKNQRLMFADVDRLDFRADPDHVETFGINPRATIAASS